MGLNEKTAKTLLWFIHDDEYCVEFLFLIQ